MNDSIHTWGQLDLLNRVGTDTPLDATTGALTTFYVYRAFDRVLQRDVTLHLLPSEIDTETHDQALERARRLASVRHPRVVAVHGVERHDERLGIWMERVEGRALEDWIRESAPAPALELVAAGIDLSLALHALHAVGLTHGQLRASSALRDAAGRVVLIDIGQGGDSSSFEQDVTYDLESLGKLLLDLALAPNRLATAPDSAESRDLSDAKALSLLRPDLPPAFCRLLELLLDSSAPLRPHSAVTTSLWISACVESELPLELPPLGPESIRTLPRPMTRMIGRSRERREIRRRLFEERFVVVTGPGGSGKTRLLAEISADLLPAYPASFAWVDLAALAEGVEIGPELLRAAGFPAAPSRSDEEALAFGIGDRHHLLALDNCEHVRESCARVLEHLLSRCPRLRVLATSRERIGLAAECSIPLPPLSLPEQSDTSLESWLRADAVRLFLDRVAVSRPSFRSAADTLPEVIRICRMVDGIPLALELAAARAANFSLSEIANRLERSLSILRGKSDRSARSATMEASIDWSYSLLETTEQSLLRRLSLLANPWTIEAARALAAEPAEVRSDLTAEDGVDRHVENANGTDVKHEVDLLVESLVQKSLVETSIGFDGSPRYHLLELIRRFARTAAEASEPLSELRGRHFDFYFSRASHHGRELFGPAQVAHASWFSELFPNLRLAFETALTPAIELPRAHEFTWYLACALERHARLPELWTSLHRMLSRDSAPSYGRGQLLLRLAECALALGRSDEGTRAADEAYDIFQGLGVARLMATARLVRATADVDNEALASARTHALEALAVRTSLGLQNEIAGAELILGFIAAREGDFAESARRYRACLERAEANGNHGLAFRASSNLAAALRDLGQLDEARALATSTLCEVRASDNREELSTSLSGLGSILRRSGEHEEARALLLEALALHSSERQPRFAAENLLELAMLSWAAGLVIRAARLLGAAEGLLESFGSPIPTWYHEEHTRLIEALSESLGESFFLVERTTGRMMNLDQAIAYARSVDPR